MLTLVLETPVRNEGENALCIEQNTVEAPRARRISRRICHKELLEGFVTEVWSV
jgi:hypothetical protein